MLNLILQKRLRWMSLRQDLCSMRYETFSNSHLRFPDDFLGPIGVGSADIVPHKQNLRCNETGLLFVHALSEVVYTK